MTFVFDRYVVGEAFGPHRLQIGADLIASWRAIYPDGADAGDRIPPGLMSVIVMCAYMSLITPRPPGNIHAGQRFEVTELPRLGDVVATTITCAGKEIKKERRFVYLKSQTVDSRGAPLFSGRFASIVAR